MIFKLQIDKNHEEEVIAVVHEKTSLIDEIENLVLRGNIKDKLPGYYDDEITLLDVNRVECFFSENDKTYAVYDDKRKYLIKKRLYELEKSLPDSFIRISKSALANWDKIAKFKVQLSGAVDVVFKSGYKDYISRRCFANLKRRYEL